MPVARQAQPETAPAEAAPNTAPSAPGRLYTTNPNEVALQRTPVPTAEVVALIRTHWPGLSEEGVRTLAAQWAAETGFGKHCYGNNFGNVKGTDTARHQYMQNT